MKEGTSLEAKMKPEVEFEMGLMIGEGSHLFLWINTKGIVIVLLKMCWVEI